MIEPPSLVHARAQGGGLAARPRRPAVRPDPPRPLRCDLYAAVRQDHDVGVARRRPVVEDAAEDPVRLELPREQGCVPKRLLLSTRGSCVRTVFRNQFEGAFRNELEDEVMSGTSHVEAAVRLAPDLLDRSGREH